MTKKRGRLVGALAALLVALTVAVAMPRTARAADGDVAQIGETTYATLANAIEAVPTDGTPTTITLIDNATVDALQTIRAGQSVVLDLAGFSLNMSKWINLQGTLVVLDGSQANSGSIEGSGTNVISVNGGSLTLQSGAISTNKTAIQIQRGSFLMQGGSVTGKTPVTLTLNAASATITGGTVTSQNGDGTAVEMTGTSTLTVGIAGTYDTPTINGAIQPSTTSTLNLLGGTIGGISGAIPASSTFGSRFTSEITGLPEGFECAQEDGYWVVRATLTEETAAAKVANGSETTLYASAQDAASALSEGDTLMLLKDVEGQLDVRSSGSVTIDLNGHSVSSTDAYAISVTQTASGTLTLKNGQQAGAKLAGAMAALRVCAQDPATVTLNYESANIEMASGAAGIQLGDNARVPIEDAALLGNGGFETTVDGARYAYGLLSAAAKDADEGTPIVLMANYRGAEPMEITEPGTFVVDLNGFTYETSAACAARVAFSNVDATFTNGAIVSTSESEIAAVVGVYLTSNTGATGVHNVDLTLEGLRLTMRNSGNAGVIVQGLNTKNDVTLDGCTLIVPSDVMGIYFPPADSTLTVTDTTITAGTGIGIKGGTLNIGGATQVIATGAKEPAGGTQSGIAETGDAIYVEGNYGDRNITVNVAGGIYQSENGSAIQQYVDPARPEENPVAVGVSGGTFDDASIGAYIAPGAAVVVSDGETPFSVYPSEAEALADGGAYQVTDGNGTLWIFATEEAASDFAEAEGVTVEVRTHTVTFDDCLEGTVNATVNVAHREAVPRPATDPALDGWTFLGWYEVANGAYAAEPYDFATPVTADLTLYAKWAPITEDPDVTPEEPPVITDDEKNDADKGDAEKNDTNKDDAEKGDGLADTGDATLMAPLVTAAVAGASAVGAAVALRRRNR